MDFSTADQVAIASYELEQYLEIQARRIESSIGSRLKELIQTISNAAIEAGKLLWQTKAELKSDDYRTQLQTAELSPRVAQRYINLAKTFVQFAPEKLNNVELTTLLSLCTKAKAPVVEELNQFSELNQQLVEEAIARHRPPRQPRQQELVTGWKQNKSGGRYYAVVLHDEDTGVSIEQQALESGLLPQKVIQEAIALRQKLKKAGLCVNDHVLSQLQELPIVVDRVRKLECENKKLKAELDVVAPNLDECKTWPEIASAVMRNRNRLLSIVREWTIEKRSRLAELLAAYLRTQPEAITTERAWVPQKLLEKALAIAAEGAA